MSSNFWTIRAGSPVQSGNLEFMTDPFPERMRQAIRDNAQPQSHLDRKAGGLL